MQAFVVGSLWPQQAAVCIWRWQCETLTSARASFYFFSLYLWLPGFEHAKSLGKCWVTPKPADISSAPTIGEEVHYIMWYPLISGILSGTLVCWEYLDSRGNGDEDEDGSQGFFSRTKRNGRGRTHQHSQFLGRLKQEDPLGPVMEISLDNIMGFISINNWISSKLLF